MVGYGYEIKPVIADLCYDLTGTAARNWKT